MHPTATGCHQDTFGNLQIQANGDFHGQIPSSQDNKSRGRAVFPNNPGPMIARTRESQVGEFTLDIPICSC